MITGNKGEWSEIYALLKIVSERQIFRGDGNLNKIADAMYPVISVLREQSNGTYQYTVEQDLVIIKNENESFRIPLKKFHQSASYLLSKLQHTTTSSFSIPEIENFIHTFNCNSIKTNSSSKSDIKIVLHDATTGISPELGFSIKSQLGRPSTLLNASGSTNFSYKLSKKLTTDQINHINSIETASKIKDRLSKISEFDSSISFDKVDNFIFDSNLKLIDSLLPNILSNIIFLFYTSLNNTLLSLLSEIEIQNPLKFNTTNNHPFYSYKIKRFLTDVALGMMPAKVWTGELDATGGYLIVKEDGEILSYHIINRNDFENYLLNNTKLETPSSTRHGFGVIYEENGFQFIKLNLQIRFIR